MQTSTIKNHKNFEHISRKFSHFKLGSIVNKAGFTLIELLIVIAIIGILASIVIPRILGSRGKAREDQAISTLREVSLSLERYKLDCGRYPASLSGSDNSGGICANNLSVFLPSSTDTSMISKYVPLSSSPNGDATICDGYHMAVQVTKLSSVTLEQDDDFDSSPSNTQSSLWTKCNVPVQVDSGFSGVDNQDSGGPIYFDIVMPHYFKGSQ